MQRIPDHQFDFVDKEEKEEEEDEKGEEKKKKKSQLAMSTFLWYLIIFLSIL